MITAVDTNIFLDILKPNERFYESSARALGGLHYRVLYFFHGRTAVVISHGLVKEREVPAKEIDRAVLRKARFEEDPAKHTYREG